MSRAGQQYERRGCSIGSDVVTASTNGPTLIDTEAAALHEHWRRMAMITLQAEPVNLSKLEFCVRRMRYWHDRIGKGDYEP